MRGLMGDGTWRGLCAHGAGAACLRRFEALERRGMEARVGEAVHRLPPWVGVAAAMAAATGLVGRGLVGRGLVGRGLAATGLAATG